MSRASFDALEAKIYAEYRARGYGVDESLHIAQATAGEIATVKHRRGAKVNRTHARRTTRARR